MGKYANIADGDIIIGTALLNFYMGIFMRCNLISGDF